MNIYIYIYTYIIHIDKYVLFYISIYIYLNICVVLWRVCSIMCQCMPPDTSHINIQVNMYLYIYICMYVYNIHVYVNVFIDISVHIYRLIHMCDMCQTIYSYVSRDSFKYVAPRIHNNQKNKISELRCVLYFTVLFDWYNLVGIVLVLHFWVLGL